MSIRAITFDFWNTLFRDANGEPRQQIRIDAFSRATGAPREDVSAALSMVWKEFDRSHRQEGRTLRPEDAVRLTAQNLGITVEQRTERELAEVFATAILEHSPVPIEGAFDAVRIVAGDHGCGLPVGLISDTGVSPGSSLRCLLDRHGFTPYFDGLTFSDEVGVAKPQAPMYENAARQLGVTPSELLHIGDMEHTDIAGAKAIGAKAVLFTGAKADLSNAPETLADYTFSSWRDFIKGLPAILMQG